MRTKETGYYASASKQVRPQQNGIANLELRYLQVLVAEDARLLLSQASPCMTRFWSLAILLLCCMRYKVRLVRRLSTRNLLRRQYSARQACKRVGGDNRLNEVGCLPTDAVIRQDWQVESAQLPVDHIRMRWIGLTQGRIQRQSKNAALWKTKPMRDWSYLKIPDVATWRSHASIAIMLWQRTICDTSSQYLQ
jgi:hypothetical protein